MVPSFMHRMGLEREPQAYLESLHSTLRVQSVELKMIEGKDLKAIVLLSPFGLGLL